MVITGYPVEDLALRPSFQIASETELQMLASDMQAQGLGDLVAIVGYLRGTSKSDSQTLGVPRGAPMNCAAVIHQGKVVDFYAKHHLPNYGVFDEYRYFVPGDHSLIVRAFGVDIGIVICEDLWQNGGPVQTLQDAHLGMLVVLNGSPFERNKDDARLALVKQRATETQAHVAYVNLCGGQDELVFDGDSIVVDPEGNIVARSPQFYENLLVCDVEISETAQAGPSFQAAQTGQSKLVDLSVATTSWTSPELLPIIQWERLDELAQVYEALVTGLHDYVNKNAFRSVLIGLSGGIDSALVATIACDALGPSRVFGVSMPSKYSSEHSKSDAFDLAKHLGIDCRMIPIAPMFDAYLNELRLTGLAEENLQARIRGMTLMGLSNQEGHLVLATGNKSELAVGYSTIYGDAVGGFAPIKDLPKTDVWALARWRNEQAIQQGEVPPIPESSITKPPSAELRPDQRDSDSLPDYSELDAILHAYVELDMPFEAIVELGIDPKTVRKVLLLIDRAEYKRRQYPPGTKVSRRAFGRDRRLPMTNRWQDME